MKITKLELLPASKYLFIKIHTDDKYVGIGEVGAWGFLDGCAAVLKQLEGYLVGKDPFQIEHHWNYMYRSMYFRGSIIMSAIAAIDIALWDIKGKALNAPIYELLGGKTRDKVRVYEAVFESDPERMVKRCLDLKKQGFTAARLMICGDIRESHASYNDSIFAHKVTDYANRVKMVREAVGNDFDLVLECHRSMPLNEAIAFAKLVEPYNPLFLEDPIAPDCPNAMVEVAQHTSLPIATGERNINIHEFETLLQKRGARFVRPDVCALGGISPSKKVAAIAEANYVGIVPHNPLGPVSTLACLQLDACIPNFVIQEFPSFYKKGGEAEMLKEAFEVADGYMSIPNGPGLGIELIDDICEKFPENQRSISAQIAFDGSVYDV